MLRVGFVQSNFEKIMNRGSCLFVFLRPAFSDLALQLPIHKKRDSVQCAEGAAGKDAKTLGKKVEESIKWYMLYLNWYN